VLRAEHRCYPLAVRLIAEGRVRVVGERVEVDGFETAADAMFLNPSD
jgi:phosphoribosylglycinamide formyltransferase 1